jgi:hypothetical protein
LIYLYPVILKPVFRQRLRGLHLNALGSQKIPGELVTLYNPVPVGQLINYAKLC